MPFGSACAAHVLVPVRVRRHEGGTMSRRIKVIGVVALLGVAASAFIVTRASGSAPPPYLSYAAKFACGEYGKLIPGKRGRQPRRPGQAGRLPDGNQRAQPAGRCGDQLREKGVVRTRAPNPRTRPHSSKSGSRTPAHGDCPDAAMLIDCQDIRKFLLTGSPVPAPAAPNSSKAG